MTDAVTLNNNIPKPHPDNDLDYDMARIILAIELIDQLIHSTNLAVSGKAASAHGHGIGEVTGLQNALDTLTANIASVSLSLDDLTDTNATDATQGMTLQFLAGVWQAVAAKAQYVGLDAVAGLAATDLQAAIGELQSVKATSADIDAAINQVVNAAPGTLDTLNELAAALGDDPNFATTISGQIAAKANLSHTHTTAQVTGLDTALAGKLSTSGKAADSDKLDGLNSSQFVRSDASDTLSGSYTITGNLTVHGNTYTGKDGGGDSWHYFYDDNSNTWRSLGWDDSANAFVAEENDGGFHKLALVYDGSSSTNTNYPIGTVIAAYGPFINRNATVALYNSSSSGDFYTAGASNPKGSVLTGTWRFRGPTSGDPRATYQRVL